MTFLRNLLIFTALLLGVSLGPSDALAQDDPQSQGISQPQTYLTPTVKEYGRPGYPRMTVYVWGNADSGVWNVEQGTDLLEFLSVISRARMTDNSPDRRRVELVSIYRDQPAGGDDPFFQAKIQELFSERNDYPPLKAGDVIVLETRTRGRFTWRDITRVTGMVATLLNTYLIIQRISD